MTLEQVKIYEKNAETFCNELKKATEEMKERFTKDNISESKIVIKKKDAKKEGSKNDLCSIKDAVIDLTSATADEKVIDVDHIDEITKVIEQITGCTLTDNQKGSFQSMIDSLVLSFSNGLIDETMMTEAIICNIFQISEAVLKESGVPSAAKEFEVSPDSRSEFIKSFKEELDGIKIPDSVLTKISSGEYDDIIKTAAYYMMLADNEHPEDSDIVLEEKDSDAKPTWSADKKSEAEPKKEEQRKEKEKFDPYKMITAVAAASNCLCKFEDRADGTKNCLIYNEQGQPIPNSCFIVDFEGAIYGGRYKWFPTPILNNTDYFNTPCLTLDKDLITAYITGGSVGSDLSKFEAYSNDYKIVTNFFNFETLRSTKVKKELKKEVETAIVNVLKTYANNAQVATTFAEFAGNRFEMERCNSAKDFVLRAKSNNGTNDMLIRVEKGISTLDSIESGKPLEPVKSDKSDSNKKDDKKSSSKKK